MELLPRDGFTIEQMNAVLNNPENGFDRDAAIEEIRSMIDEGLLPSPRQG